MANSQIDASNPHIRFINLQIGRANPQIKEAHFLQNVLPRQPVAHFLTGGISIFHNFRHSPN